MRTGLLLAAISLGTSAIAAPANDAKTGSAGDQNEIVCRSMAETGSRLKSRRVCMSRAEWAELRRQQREAIEKGQNSACMPGANC
jgi:hypothetical protein